MRYLIDGYNLIHAMGLIRGRAGPWGLEKARRNLLGVLWGALGDEASEVTVVFDAAWGPGGGHPAPPLSGNKVHIAPKTKPAQDFLS
ncbi:MAG: NYN domain-containing protein, partial [Gemmataceae bacterium]|nr:NYN domain-containing protein [Gemmataceae bacterium]MDW8265978.1 NYN domain-containing protein [Gemmataceae bacterium]